MVINHPERKHVDLPQALSADSYCLQTSSLAGAEYYQFEEIAPFLKVGAELQLIAEPANPYDKYAVRVHFQEHHLGYLPRASNHVASRLLRQGAPLTAKIAYLYYQDRRPMSLHVLMKKS